MINQAANERFDKGRGAQFNPKNKFLKWGICAGACRGY